MAITLMTFLRFSSCQNCMSLLGLPGMLWCDWSYAIYNLTEYESNNEALLKADQRRLNRPVARVTNVAKATTDTELTGIRMAATMGERFPVMAKLIPTIL